MPKTTFSNGDASQGIHGTRVTAEFLNAVNSHYHTGLDQDGHGALAYAADIGTANAYVVTLSPALSQYVTGMPIYFKAANANTGASTIDVNGLGQAPVKRLGNDLQAGDIRAGQIISLAYDGTSFQIMSGSPPQIRDVTYAELSAMATAGTLVPGQLYGMMDFRTYHILPPTADEYNEGPIEYIILLALSATEFHAQVYSPSYPQDIIYYELTDSSGLEGDRGRIYFRHEPIKNNKAFCDWRAVKRRLWETVQGSGIFDSFYTKPYAYQDFPIFDSNNSKDLNIGGPNYYFRIPDVVLQGWVEHVEIGGNATCLAVDRMDEVYVASYGHLIAYKPIDTIRIHSNSSVILNDYVSGLVVGGNTGVHFQGDIYDCQMWYSAGGLILSGNHQHKVVQSGRSTFEATIDITGLGTNNGGSGILNLYDYRYAGIVNLASSNAQETLVGIDYLSTIFPVEFRPGSGLTITWTTTTFPLTADTELATYSLNPEVNGSLAGFIRFKKLPGKVGNYQDLSTSSDYQN